MRILTLPKRLFLLIEEPRVWRIMQFSVYVILAVTGGSIVTLPPSKFTDLIGEGLTLAFGAVLIIGGILSAVGVMWLPAAQWVERAGIVALTMGWLIFLVLVVFLGASVAGFGIGLAFALMLTMRYMEIRPLRIPKQV